MEADSDSEDYTIEQLELKGNYLTAKAFSDPEFAGSRSRLPKLPPRRLQKQTVTEWETHRDTIRQLYSRMPLKDVLHRMDVEHGFKASRRMYYAQFKKWGLQKNLKAEQKDHLEAILSTSWPPPWELASNENICKRIERHRKTKRSGETFRSWSPNQYSTFRGPPWIPTHVAVPCDSFLLSSSSARRRTSSITPSDPAIGDADLESILRCIDSLLAFHEHPSPEICISIAENPCHPLDSFRRFWGNLGYGIHLLKTVVSTREAFSLIDQACADAPAALTSDNFTFILGLLTTLSPVNNKRHPGVRASLLKYLTILSHVRLGPNHPLHRLCSELLYKIPSRQLCENALSYMLAQQTRAIGNTRSSILCLRVSLVASKLRDDDYDGVIPMVEDLVSDFGIHDDASLLQDRFATRELEHILLENQESAHSLDTCLSIIWMCNSPLITSNVEISHEHRAGFPARGLDTAKIDELTRAPGMRALWLRRSVGVARALWGDSPGYQQVAERLSLILKHEGMHEEGPQFLP